MIAKIHKTVVSDEHGKSEVYDVLIEESGVTLASIPCIDVLNAVMLLDAIQLNSNVQVVRGIH